MKRDHLLALMPGAFAGIAMAEPKPGPTPRHPSPDGAQRAVSRAPGPEGHPRHAGAPWPFLRGVASPRCLIATLHARAQVG